MLHEQMSHPIHTIKCFCANLSYIVAFDGFMRRQFRTEFRIYTLLENFSKQGNTMSCISLKLIEIVIRPTAFTSSFLGVNQNRDLSHAAIMQLLTSLNLHYL